jgi:Polyketide cyclase / dehydrase and lipid transport
LKWQFEHRAKSAASKENVWARYADVANWSEWSVEGVEWSRLDGPFEVGSTGKSKPPGRLPAGSFRVDAVVPNEMYRSETKLPGARLLFEHIIEPADEGVTITHRAILDGPLARLWGRVLRKSMERGLPPGVERLAATTAADQETPAAS